MALPIKYYSKRYNYKILIKFAYRFLVRRSLKAIRLLWLKFNVAFFQKNFKYVNSELTYYSENSSKILCYGDASENFSFSPLVKNHQKKEKIKHPNLYFRSIYNSYSSPYSSSFLLENKKVAIPDHLSIEIESPTTFESLPLILSHSKSLIYTLREPFKYCKKLNCKVFIVGGTTNWYHFIFETLPKLYLVDKFYGSQNQNILLTHECLAYKNFEVGVKLFSKSHNIITSVPGEILYIEEAITIDDFNCAPKHVGSSHKLGPSDWSINSSMLLEFARIFRSKLVAKNILKEKNFARIFLARKESSDRGFNQKELVQIALRYGFKIIFLENYSLYEQYNIISNAEYLVGPPGAAWTALIFSELPLKCLSWIPKGKYKYSSLYSTISKILGHHMMFFYSGTKLQIGSANFNQYYVRPKVFEQNLIKLINS